MRFCVLVDLAQSVWMPFFGGTYPTKCRAVHAVLQSAEALLAGGDAECEAVGVDEAASVDLVQAVRGVGPVGADAAAATFRKEDAR